MRKLIWLTVFFAGAAAAAEPVLTPRESSYDVQWGATTLGEGTISLAEAGDKGCYRYESVTRPVALVRWFYGSPRETSLFCVKDGVIRPTHFEYVNNRREKDSYTLDFDWGSRKVKTLDNGNLTLRELPEIAYDRFVLQQAVRLWLMEHAKDEKPGELTANMVDDDSIKPLRFAIIGRERVDTLAGSFDTIRVERVDNPNRVTRTWFAPDRDYTIVKVEHVEHGEVQLRMLLNR